MNKGYTREIKGSTCTHTHTEKLLENSKQKKSIKQLEGKKFTLRVQQLN